MKKENLKKLLLNLLGIGVGLIVFILIMNALAFPSNYEFSFSPMDAFNAYFFFWGFMWGLLGIIVGTLLLFSFILLINWGVIVLVKLICRKYCCKSKNE